MALKYSPQIVTDGLILALDAADKNSYPGSGTTWYDLSGNNLHMSLINGPTYSNGALIFDGADDYAERTGVGLAYPSFTVDTFVKPSSNPGNYRAFFSSTLASNDDYWFGINWDMSPYSTSNFQDINLEVSRGYGGFYNRDVMTSSIPFNTWVHLAVVIDATGNTYKQYVNGQEEYNGVYDGTTTNFDRIRVGARYYSGGAQGSFFPGAISKTSLYNRALSPTEVQQNYNAFRARFGL
jgi:hypothetical protein